MRCRNSSGRLPQTFGRVAHCGLSCLSEEGRVNRSDACRAARGAQIEWAAITSRGERMRESAEIDSNEQENPGW